jgi:V/A-type H+-transporting ATPase subunit I
MAVGFLDGEVFANESILIRPMGAVSGFLTGVPVDRVLHLMPEKGNLNRLFLFFGFTIAVGVVLIRWGWSSTS